MLPKYSQKLTLPQNVAIFMWKRKGIFWSLCYTFFLSILLSLYSLLNNPEKCDFWAMLQWLVNNIVSLRSKIFINPSLYLLETLLLPILATALFTVILQYFALPKSVKSLQKTMGNSCKEVVRLSLSRLEHLAKGTYNFASSVRTGAVLDPIEAIEISRSLVEITPANNLFTTCLQTPNEMYSSEYRETLRIMADTVKREGKQMIRIVVCDRKIFDDKTKAVTWFKKMHNNDSLKLLCIGSEDFKNLARACHIETSRMDVLMFDKRVVYALETTESNSSERFCVSKVNGTYRIYLMDDPEDLLKYKKFFDELKVKADAVSIRK